MSTLPDTDRIFRSPVRMTKSPGYKGECLKYVFSLPFWLILAKKFEIFEAFCGFYSIFDIFVVEKSRSSQKIGGLPNFDFCRLASLPYWCVKCTYTPYCWVKCTCKLYWWVKCTCTPYWWVKCTCTPKWCVWCTYTPYSWVKCPCTPYWWVKCTCTQ